MLALSLGQSGVYAVIELVAKLTEPGGLASQTAVLNRSLSPRPLLDLTYQLTSIVFALVPVALVFYLMSGERPSAARRLGVDVPDRRTLGSDLVRGAGLAALIGIPGLGLYFLARALDLNATVVPSTLTQYWWTLPVLVLAAVQNAVLEEVVVVGYLITRVRQIGAGAGTAIVLSAVVRGSYHLYQGFGAFLGNAVMGLVFGWFYTRTGRTLPLVIAHALIDVVAFVGYAVLGGRLGL